MTAREVTLTTFPVMCYAYVYVNVITYSRAIFEVGLVNI